MFTQPVPLQIQRPTRGRRSLCTSPKKGGEVVIASCQCLVFFTRTNTLLMVKASLSPSFAISGLFYISWLQLCVLFVIPKACVIWFTRLHSCSEHNLATVISVDLRVSGLSRPSLWSLLVLLGPLIQSCFCQQSSTCALLMLIRQSHVYVLVLRSSDSK